MLNSGTSNIITVGLGGGGTMYSPVVSPHDPDLMLVACDMGGLYRLKRSPDGSFQGQLINGREMDMPATINGSTVSTPYRVAFHPTDPNTIYAAGVRRGLRSSNSLGDGTWTKIPGPWDGQREAIVIIAIDSTNQLYIGTQSFDNPTGNVYCQNNQGQWQTCKDGNGANIIGITVGFVFLTDPTLNPPPPVQFLAIRNKVFRLNSATGLWDDITAGLPIGGDNIRGFAGGADQNHLVLYVTLPGNSGVYRYVKQKNTWMWEQAGGLTVDAEYERLGVAKMVPDTVYATAFAPDGPAIYRSTDAGNSWDRVYDCPGNQMCHFTGGGWLDYEESLGFGGPPLGFAVSPSNPNVAMFTHMGGVYVMSSPTGVDWQAAYTAPDGARAANKDWQSIGVEVTTVWHYYIDPHDPSRHYICYTDIGFAYSHDNGHTWRHNPPKDLAGNGYNTVYELAFDPDHAGQLWAAVSNQHDIPYSLTPQNPTLSTGGAISSNDFGQTWQNASGNLPSAPVVSIVFDKTTDPSKPCLWASVYGQGVYYSDNRGQNWTSYNTGLGSSGNKNFYRLYLHSDGTLFCAITASSSGSDGTGLWRLPKGSSTWQSLTSNIQNLSYVTDYAVHPTKSNYIYLCTFHSSVPGTVYKSEDGGASWVQALNNGKLQPKYANDDETSFFAPFFDPDDPDHVAYVTSVYNGIRRTTDAGQTWRETYLEVPFLNTQRLTFDRAISGSPSTYITTFGAGVFKLSTTPLLTGHPARR